MEKCYVCEQEKEESEGRDYTPREIVDNFLVEPGTAKDVQMRLAAMAAVAASIIQFDNPPGGADLPMNWICKACQTRFFSKATTGKKYAKEGRLGVYDFKTGTSKRSRSSSQPRSDFCFVATACCGSPDCPEVKELKRFRDNFLLPSKIGRCFVSLYYTISPSIAALLRQSPFLRSLVKSVLVLPIYRMIRRS